MNVRRILTASLFVAICSLVGISPILHSQYISALTGIVTDTTGAVLPNVKVALVDTATNSNYQATTNSTGLYTISSVRPAETYKVTFTAADFKMPIIEKIAIAGGGDRLRIFGS
jgi:hypothetical protein